MDYVTTCTHYGLAVGTDQANKQIDMYVKFGTLIRKPAANKQKKIAAEYGPLT